MLRYTLTLEGQTFEVEILSDPRISPVQVRVDGQILTVRVDDATGNESAAAQVAVARPAGSTMAAGAAPLAHPDAASRSDLVAPLPGTVVQISVEPGQPVRAGDELLVIEAMKMNNRIRSPQNGIVSHVAVQVGQQVSHGETLLAWEA
jgi:propionyl-CoA carboxylase alpha chain